MQLAHRLLSAAALALLSASPFASTVTYTSSGTFLPLVAPGAYTETFTGFGNPPGTTTSFSGGGFAYDASSDLGLYLEGGFLGTNLPDRALTITFTGADVFALGANFYATDISDAFQAVALTITLSDGTITSFTPTSVGDSYRGYVSDAPIASLVISAPGQSLYAGLDNLTVGRAAAAVPEPTSWILAGLGLAGLLVARRRTV